MIPTTQRSPRSLWTDPFAAFERELDWLRSGQRSNGHGHGHGHGAEREHVAAYPADIYEDSDNIYIDAELPGFRNEEVEVVMEDGVLTITAERKPEQAQGTYHLHERRWRRAQRSFSVPSTVDENNIEATLRDGVLHLTLRKREEVKPRKIQIR